MGTPYCLKCGWMRNIPGLAVQRCVDYDAMCNAYHREVVHAGLVLPYYEAMDKESWFYSQWFATELSLLLYPGHVLQINTVHVDNIHHGEYLRGNAFILESVRQVVLRPGGPLLDLRLAALAAARQNPGIPPPVAAQTLARTTAFPTPAAQGRELYAVPEHRRRALFHLDADYWKHRGEGGTAKEAGTPPVADGSVGSKQTAV